MIPERRNDTPDQSDYSAPAGSNAREENFHGDLEHSSPTDSRADEKVIINHRVEHAPSFRDRKETDSIENNNG